MKVEFHIGIDDTDSPRGGCTTYTMSILSDRLQHEELELDGYPCLVRLNPNVPWKTRGNAATALHLKVPKNRIGEVKEAAIKTVEETSDVSQPNTDPAIVFLEGPVPSILRERDAALPSLTRRYRLFRPRHLAQRVQRNSLFRPELPAASHHAHLVEARAPPATTLSQ